MGSPQRLFLTQDQLVSFARFYAEECSAGLYAPTFDPEERWHQRIYRDARVDVWLITWLPSQGTQLHDHGGSSGAFAVMDGELTEAVVAGGSTLHDTTRRAGEAVGFGAHYVHDVRNLSDAPAVSVHAYSPPLTTMTYYDLNDGRLDAIASLATDDPEPQFVAHAAAS